MRVSSPPCHPEEHMSSQPNAGSRPGQIVWVSLVKGVKIRLANSVRVRSAKFGESRSAKFIRAADCSRVRHSDPCNMPLPTESRENERDHTSAAIHLLPSGFSRHGSPRQLRAVRYTRGNRRAVHVTDVVKTCRSLSILKTESTFVLSSLPCATSEAIIICPSRKFLMTSYYDVIL